MKLFYLVSAIVVTVLILILASAQFATVCTWYLISPQTPPVLVLMQVAALGAIVGGLLILYWKFPKSTEEDEMEDAKNE